jgi:hypothetical protein
LAVLSGERALEPLAVGAFGNLGAVDRLYAHLSVIASVEVEMCVEA